jgi:RNA methyltransferase, TrmH family
LYYGDNHSTRMQIGKHSPKLVNLRKAIRQGSVTPDGLLPIEGPILLEEAARSGIEIAELFVRAGTKHPDVVSKEIHEVPPEVFKTIQETEHSQGIVATVRPRRFELNDIVGVSPALITVLARLQDPGNVGTILRVAEAFGATGVVAVHGTASLYNGKVVRASAGSLFRLPHIGGLDSNDLIGALKSRNISIVGTSPIADSSIEEWDWTTPTAVLIGNEGGGLSADEIRYCDRVLRIPHGKTVESLNSAIAAAVILYEASKQRR